MERISKYKKMNKYLCFFFLAAYNMFYLVASVVFVVCIIISLLVVLMALACNVPKVIYCIQCIVSFIVALSLLFSL